jgi:hypothetical protein
MEHHHYQLLQRIRERPMIFIGKPSLKRLRHFLSGYVVCYHTVTGDNKFDIYPGFQKFVAKKYDISLSTHHTDIIYFMCLSDDEQAFYCFFELLDEFLDLQKNEG